jgi:hypothetical protein
VRIILDICWSPRVARASAVVPEAKQPWQTNTQQCTRIDTRLSSVWIGLEGAVSEVVCSCAAVVVDASVSAAGGAFVRLRCCCGYTNPESLTILHTQYSTFSHLNWVRGGGEEGA